MDMNASKSITQAIIEVVLVDDHELARQGVRKLLGNDTSIKIVGEAAACSEAISLINRLKPDVVLLDIRLEKGSGIDVARFIKSNMPEIKILILTAYNDDQYVRAMARIGVSGYLIKTISAKQLRRAIHDVAEGGLFFQPDVSAKVISLLQNSTKEDAFEIHGNSGGCHKPADMLARSRGLTNRETEVFGHVACGLRNHEVAKTMDITVKTVEAHVRHILRKLGARNRTQAVINANMSKWQ